MNLICAVDQNWGIGRENELLYHIPEDMRYFREMTKGKTLVCGKNTLFSFPGQKPLPGRVHFVLTHAKLPENEFLFTFDSAEKLLEKIAPLPSDSVMLIGGGSVYRQLYRFCHLAYITKIYSDKVPSTVFFPNLDEDPDFELIDEGERKKTESGLEYAFLTYRNTRVPE